MEEPYKKATGGRWVYVKEKKKKYMSLHKREEGVMVLPSGRQCSRLFARAVEQVNASHVLRLGGGGVNLVPPSVTVTPALLPGCLSMFLF